MLWRFLINNVVLIEAHYPEYDDEEDIEAGVDDPEEVFALSDGVEDVVALQPGPGAHHAGRLVQLVGRRQGGQPRGDPGPSAGLHLDSRYRVTEECPMKGSFKDLCHLLT